MERTPAHNRTNHPVFTPPAKPPVHQQPLRYTARAWRLSLVFLLALTTLLFLYLGLAGAPLTLWAADTVHYVAPGGADSASCTVYAPCRTIQRAVANAQNGDEIRIAAGAYTNTLILDKSLTLRGGFTTTNWTVPDPANNITVLDAQQTGTAIVIPSARTITMYGLRITGGNAPGDGGGIRNDLGTLTVENCWIYANRATGNGGGISNGTAEAAPAFVLRNTAIFSNTSQNLSGGGLAIIDGNVTVEACTFYSNTADFTGGAIAVADGNAYIRSNVFYTNTALTQGGGMAINNAFVQIENNTFYQNYSALLAGAIYVDNHTIGITNNLFVNNNAQTNGGGLYTNLSAPALTVAYNDFYNNAPDHIYDGAAQDPASFQSNNRVSDPQFVAASSYNLHISSGSPARNSGAASGATIDFEGQPRPFETMDRGADEVLVASACYARVQGGAVYTDVQAAINDAPSGGVVQLAGFCNTVQTYAGTPQIAHVAKSLTLRGGYTLTNWSHAVYGPTVFDAHSAGRGLYIASSGAQVQVENLWIENGAAIGGSTDGAGIYIGDGVNAALRNLVLVDNTAAGNGGAIRVGSSQVTIVHSTLYRNSASIGGGIYATGSAQVTLNSSIVVSNTASSGGSGIEKGGGASASLAYNDFFNNSYGAVAPGSTDLNVPPGFVNQSTLDLRLDYNTSVLINAADPASPLAQDAQGYPRPLGARADIGAYESRWYADVALSPSPNEPIIVTDATTIEGQMIPFTHTVANVGIAPNSTDTFALLAGNSHGWDVAVVGIAPTFVLTQGESLTFYVHVTVPVDAPEPFYNTTWVTATVQNHPSSYAVVEDEIGTPRIELYPSYIQNADPGEIITYTHTLTNAGPVSDTLDIYFSSSLGWSTRVSPTDFSTITLQSGESVQILVQVNVTSTAPANLEDVAILRAESTRFSDIEAQVTDRTIANRTVGDRYVAQTSTASDTQNNCTQMNKPCASIAYAVKQAMPGDTIFVAQGVYYETDEILLNSNINLRGGYNPDGYTRAAEIDPTLTVVDMQNDGRVLRISTPSNTLIVEGFTLRNGAPSGKGGAIYLQDESSPTLIHLTLENSTASYGGGIYVENGHPILDHVTISNTHASVQGGGIYLAGKQIDCSTCVIGESSAPTGGGIYIASGATFNTWNSLIYNNTSSAGSGGGIYNGGTLNLFNATLVGNAAANTAIVYGGGIYGLSGSRTTITNTIVASNTATSPAGSSGGGVYLLGSSTLDYNDFWANAAASFADSNVSVGAHSISADPLFVDSNARDFHLTPDSPCVDTADPATALIDDFEGDLRPSNQGYDIGADELSGCLARVMTPDQRTQVGPVYGILQEAIDQAPEWYVIQVAGTCRGVQVRNGISQTVMITKSLTIRGGFSSNFSAYDPGVYTTTLDAQGLGRTVVVIDMPIASLPVTLSNLLLTGGDAAGLGGGPGNTDAGGAVYVSGAQSRLILRGVTIIDNHAAYGGGAYVGDGRLILDADLSLGAPILTRIVGNSANWGGGLYNGPAGNLQVAQSTLISNTAVSHGGGIYNAGTLYLANGFVVSNTAGSYGGGLYNVAVSLTLRHDTFFGNAAADLGGGIYQAASSAQPVINSTLIVSNTAGGGGGGIYSPIDTFAFNYNDLFGNLVGGSPGDYGGALDAGDGTGNISVDPGFISLNPANAYLLKIPASSPVEDVGDPSSPVIDDVDQDPRPSNQGFDIGADEVGGCYVRNQRTGIIYGSIQRAVDQSQEFDLLQVAGACRGVNTQVDGGQPVKQTVFLDISLNIKGGYTNTNWGLQPSPGLRPTYLDALSLGRVAYITNSAQITLSGLHLIGGLETNGGAIWVGDGVLTVTESFIHHNQATRGGAAYNAGGALLIGPNTEIMTNTATDGGAIYSASGDTSVDSNHLHHNMADNGGALLNAGGALTVTNNIIEVNQATLGAAIYNASGASLRVWHNAIYSNTATNGGGLYTVDALLDVRNNLFVSNTAASGCAIYSTIAFASDYNDAFPAANAYGGIASAGSHSLSVDPAFVDAPGGDFHIQEGSPVREKGDPAMTLWHDFEDDLRPGHQGFDMGVDEIPGCRARIRREPAVIYGNPQWAIYHSQPGDVIEITGDRECWGMHSLTLGSDTVWQTVHITHNLTLIGGYDEAFAAVISQTVFNPGASIPTNPGRALLITGTGSVTVSNIVMYNGQVSGTGLPTVHNAGGALFNASTALTLTNCVFHTNQATYGGAIYNLGALVSWNSIAYGNTANGGGGGGLYENGANSRILHNVFYQNTANASNGGGVYAAGGNPGIFNSIFVTNTADTGGAIYAPAAGPVLDYNDYLGNQVSIGGSTFTGTHSLSVDPLWLNPGGGDFHLDEDSPLIDAGADMGVPFDIDNDPRPINTAPDIGADEYNACLARVESTGDIYGRIQDAIDHAQPGDTIRVAEGTCKESIHIDKSLTIIGSWNTDFVSQYPRFWTSPLVPIRTLLDALNLDRAITIDDVDNVNLYDLSLGSGNAGGASIDPGNGGGIWSQAAKLTLANVGIMSNTATNGGGIYLADGELAVPIARSQGNDISIFLNVATGNGGGIYNSSGVTATLFDTFIGAPHPLLLLNLPINWGNTAENLGGGLYNTPDSHVRISGGPIKDNWAVNGGGIYNAGAELSVVNAMIYHNAADSDGGGLYIASGSDARLINVIVYSNTAESDGGGIYRDDATADDLIAHNTIYENWAGANGGGVYNVGTSLPISASIVASNTGSSGSGIYGASVVNVDYTLRWNNTYGGSTNVSNELVADPNFREGYDPLLHYDSPAIDAVPGDASDVDEDMSLDPRDAPYINFSPLCAKDMGADEYIVQPLLDIGLPSPSTAVVSPTETISYNFAITNSSINWYNVIFAPSERVSLEPGSGYTETVKITLTSDYPDWSRIAAIAITSTDGAPVLPGANVVIAPDGRSASLALHPAYRADISVTVTVPAYTLGDQQDNSFLEFRFYAGNDCPGAVIVESNSAVAKTEVLDDYNFVIAPDNWGAALPGQTITYSHIITNLGNITNTYILNAAGFYAVGKIAQPLSGTVTLAPGMSETLVMSVTINPEAAGGLVDITNLTAIISGTNIYKSAADNTAISYTVGTRYVSINGQDSLVDETELTGVDYADNNCTQPNVEACRTIQQALNQADDGDVIKIANGVYTDVFTFTHQSAEITQIAYITKSLTLRGGYLTSDWEQMPGNHLTHTTALDPAGAGRGIYVAAGAVVTIDRLTVRNGSADDGAGIYCGGALTVQNVFLHDNQATSNGGALYISGTATLQNDTLFRNSASGGSGSAIYFAAGSANLVNTIIATHTASVALYGMPGASISADHNLYYGNPINNGGTMPAPGGDDLLQDPRFRDIVSVPPDLHLQNGSPASNTGTPVPLNTDYDNDYRPLSTVYDIGADEYLPRQNLLFYPDRSDTAPPDSTVTFTHTLHNDSDIADVVTLTLSSNLGWTTVTEPAVGAPIALGIGAERTIWVTITVPVGAQGQTFVAWITATSGANPAVSAAVRDQIDVQSVDWQITKTVKPGSTIQPGGTLTYTIIVTNGGDLDSFGYNSIYDQMPEHTHLVDPGWGSLEYNSFDQKWYMRWHTDTVIHVGESISVSFVVTVSAPLTDGTPIANGTYFVFGSNAADGIGDPLTVTVSAPAQLSISKATDHSPLQPGDWLTYTVTVTNSASAPGPATNVLITDTLPAEVVLDSLGFVAPATGFTSQAGRDLTWSLDDALQPGQSAQVTVTVRVTSPLNVAVLTNRFGVTSATAPAGSAGALDTPVDAANAITLSKTVEPTWVEPGVTVTYTIVITNSGAGIATVDLDDALDPAFAPDTWSTTLVVPGRTWDGAPGVRTVSFTATAPAAGGVYYNRSITATYDGPQAILQDAAPLHVQLPLDGLTLVNDSPTEIGQSTTLTASLVAGENVTYTFDLGDGNPLLEGTMSASTPVSWTHTYAPVGTYTATITATDGIRTQVATTTVSIQEPIAGLSALNDSPTELGNPTALTATVTSGSNVVYTWAFGDGTIGASDTVTHTYPSVLTYTAVVTASNGVSQLVTTTVVTITDALIRDLAAINDSPTVLGQPTTFTATLSSGSNVTYTWDFGDTTISPVSPVPTTTHIFAPGAYTAIVTASNTMNWMTATTTVIVQEAIAGLTWVGDSPTVSGTNTTFTATISSGTDVTYTVDLGDGSPPPSGVITAGLPLTLTYAYTMPGAYTAVITVENLVSRMTATVTILVEEAIAGLVAVNDSPTELGSLTALTATVTAGSNVVYEWSLGDGITTTGAIPTHIYPAIGVYTAIVTASNSVSQITATTTVTIVDAPIGGLAAINDSPALLGQQTAFTATLSTGSNVVFEWAFGNGASGSGATTTYIYPAAGVYTAIVTASNSVNAMTATTVVTVQEAVAGLTLVNDSPTLLTNATTLTATLATGSDATYLIDWGDGLPPDSGAITAGAPLAVLHTCPAAGVYTAVMTVSNAVSSVSASTVITIEAPISGLSAINDSPTPLGYTTTLTATVATGSNVVFEWDFGDGNTGSGPIITHRYDSMGIYTAVVTASNTFGTFTTTTQVTITLPLVNLAAAYSVIEGDGQATITVTLSAPMGTPVTVQYATADGTATDGIDYEGRSGLLTFDPGVIEGTFTILIYDDGAYEADETVLLSLSNPGNADLGNALSTLTIVNDDGRPTVSLSGIAYQVDEWAGLATITVTLSHPSDETITVDYATQDGTATAGVDYGATSGTLTFAPDVLGQTFTIPIYDDGDIEGDETVQIVITNAVNALLPRPNDATLTIIDDESLVGSYFVYLPIVLKNYTPLTNRDLIVTDIRLASGDPTVIEVTIRNIGTNSVPYPFWVDLYVDPSPPPVGAGDLWNPPRCAYGGAWFVTTEIPAGGSLTLSTNNLDPAYSLWPAKLPAGTHAFYAQVDAYGSGNGMIYEDNESNNIYAHDYAIP